MTQTRSPHGCALSLSRTMPIMTHHLRHWFACPLFMPLSDMAIRLTDRLANSPLAPERTFWAVIASYEI